MRAFSVLVGLLLVGAFAAGGCGSETPEATVDPALVLALQPACAGDAVPGAGALATTTAVPNHLVVLDGEGALSEFALAMPAAWIPPSLADTELVTCVTEVPRHQIQVCDYYGSDITRYAVTDEFLVVEAASGREIARFTITDEPRTCAPTENASTTELTGFIEAETVVLHLAGLVENGVFVDPDLPVSSDKPDSSGNPDASSVTPGKPTAVPSTSPDVIDLRAALADELVSVAGTGNGLQSLDLEVTSEVDRSLEILIEAGTLLEPRARGTQTMMVVWGTTISLAPEATQSLSLDVACAQMHQDQPTGDDSFTVSRAVPERDLLLLLAEPSLVDASGRVEQFAVWTITNNPRQNGYVGLTSGFAVFGTGPSDEELAEIKAIFESAGIDTDKYRALR